MCHTKPAVFDLRSCAALRLAQLFVSLRALPATPLSFESRASSDYVVAVDTRPSASPWLRHDGRQSDDGRGSAPARQLQTDVDARRVHRHRCTGSDAWQRPSRPRSHGRTSTCVRRRVTPTPLTRARRDAPDAQHRPSRLDRVQRHVHVDQSAPTTTLTASQTAEARWACAIR